MSKVSITLFLVASILLVSCNKDDDDMLPTASGHINFSDLKVGQKSIYLNLTGENYFDNEDIDFEYQTDTLIVEITGKQGGQFIIKEYLTPGSSVLNGGENIYISQPDVVGKYFIRIENDSLFTEVVTENYYPKLFRNGLSLKQVEENELEIKGWKTSLSYCECDRIGYTKNYEQFGVTYDRLDVHIYNSPMAYDGPGTTIAVHKNKGIVRSAFYSWWTQSGTGWDLLP